MKQIDEETITSHDKTAAEVDLILEEAWKNARVNPAKAKEQAQQALDLSQKINYKKGIAFAIGHKGSAMVWLSEFDEALDLLIQSHKLLEELEEFKQLIQVLYMIGVIFYFLGDNEKQLQYILNALEISKKINDIHGEATCLNGIGTVYYSMGEDRKAVEFLNKAFKSCTENEILDVLPRVLDGLGHAHYNLKEYEKALEYKLLCLDNAKEKGIKQVQSYALDGIGEIYQKLNQFEKAHQYFNECLDLRKEIGFKAGEAETYLHIGTTYLVSDDLDNASINIKKALSIADELQAKDIIFKCHFELSNLYEKINDLKNFATHFRAYHKYKEEYHSEKSKQKFKSIELESKMDAIEKEKEILQKQNEQLERYYNDIHTLSEIGKDITSTLDIDEILSKLYNQINDLMDASVFLIGLFDDQKGVLLFKFAIENGERLPEIQLSLENDKERIAVWVANNKKEAIINDMATDVSKYTGQSTPPAIMGEQPESMIYIPLLSQDNLVGILSVQSFKKNAYSEYHVNILRNLAVYAAIAIENANIYSQVEQTVEKRTREVIQQKEELENNHRNTKLLNAMGQQLISTLDIEIVFNGLHDNVNELMDAACFGIRLYDKENNVVNYKYEYESGNRYPEASVPMNTENNYSVWCIKNKKPIFINDNSTEYVKYVEKVHVVSGDFPYSLIFQPLMKGDEILGVITVQSFEKNAYTQYHLDILQSLASYTVIALENARMYEVMEKKVEERTKELQEQKTIIENNHKELEQYSQNVILLSELGKQITSHLDINKINKAIYKSLSKVMDAPSMGVGIYDEEDNAIRFPGYLEKNKELKEVKYHLNDNERLAVVCFKNEKEILISDYEKEFSKYLKTDKAPIIGESVASIIYIPLKLRNKTIGVITVQSFNKNAYTDYHFNFVRNLAVYAAIALENAQLYEGLEEIVEERTKKIRIQKEEIEKNHKNTELLSKIGKDITSSLSIDIISDKVYNNVNTLMDASCFGIGIHDPATDLISMAGFIENNEKMPVFSYQINDERLASVCYRNEQEIFINNYFNEHSKYLKGIKKAISGKDASSIIYLPVYSKDKIIGVITVQSFSNNAYTEYHLNILRNLAVYVGIAIENATLYEHLEEKVKERTQEVIQQKEIIEEKNKNITDSIKYAKRIQDATLPDATVIKKYFSDAFVLFKPKDIVSGDFYWFENVIDNKSNQTDKILFAVVDCTGHGVPGAFMSLIGNNALNQIVNEYGITQPAGILEELDKIISSRLSKNNEFSQVKDGMDLAICSFDIKTRELEFAGAYNPLWIVRNNEIIEIKGDKIAIGLTSDEQRDPFTNHKVKLEKGDELYLFSDGFADQFGGPRGKKLKVGRFKELLGIKAKSMADKRKILDDRFNTWIGDFEQIDDVCVIGISV